MSIRIMAAIWEIPLPPTEKLVLLALADAANDEGICWPSISTIARKSGFSERSVQRSIRAAEKMGLVKRDEVVGKGCKYRLTPRHCGTPDTAAPATETPKTPDTVAPKPLRTIIPKKAKASLGARKTRLPANFEPVLTESVQAIIDIWPPGMLERELAQFKDRNTASGETYKCWQAAFRTWVRNAEKWRVRDGHRKPNPDHEWGRTVAAADSLIDEIRAAAVHG